MRLIGLTKADPAMTYLVMMSQGDDEVPEPNITKTAFRLWSDETL